VAFPTKQGTPAESATTTAGTSHVVNLPGSLVVGEEIIVIMGKAQAVTINALTGWTELVDENVANGAFVARHIVDGTEGATVTFTSSGSTKSASLAYRISGHGSASIAPQISTVATGTSNAPNPSSLSPTGGAKDYLWITFFVQAGEEADDDTWTNNAATNYSGLVQVTSGTAGTAGTNCSVAASDRTNNAASEDAVWPAASTDQAIGWRAFTISIQPYVAQEFTDSGTVPLVITPSGVTGSKARVYWVEFEIPEAASGTEHTDSGTIYVDIQVSSFDLHKGNPATRGSIFLDGNMSWETQPLGTTMDRPYTVGVWIKPLWLPSMTVQAPASLGRDGAGAEGALPLLSSPTSAAAYEEYNSDFENQNAGSAFPENQWNSLAAVFASHSSRKAFVNGDTSGGTGTGAMATPIPDHNRIYMGKFPDGSWDYRGWIAYLFVWEYALTDAEITAWHNGDLIRDPSRGASYFWDLTLPGGAFPEYEDWWNATVLTPLGADALIDTGNVPPVIYEIPTIDTNTVTLKITVSGVDEHTVGGGGTEYTDSNTVPLLLTPSAVEGRESADVNTIYVDLQVSAVETREIFDAATVLLDIQLSSTEFRETLEVGSIYVDLQPSATEYREGLDASTVTVVLSPSATEFKESSSSYEDTGTISVVITPSSLDAQERFDSATVPVTLTPSATETREIFDSGTVTLVIIPSGIDVITEARRGIVYWVEFEIPVPTEEYIDAGTVYFDITPSATEEFPTNWTDSGTVTLTISVSSVDLAAGTPVPGSIRGLMGLYVSEISVTNEDSGTVYVDLQVSSVESRESADTNTIYVDLQASAIEGRESADVNTVYVDLQVSSVEGRESADVGTVYVDVTPSSTDAQERFDSATINYVITPSATEFKTSGYEDAGTVSLTVTPTSTDTAAYVEAGQVYVTITVQGTAEGFDAGTVNFVITPATIQEHVLEFDTLLVGVLSRTWTGALQSERRFGGSMANNYSATLQGTLRFTGSLNSRRYSGVDSNRWSGTLGRI